MIKLLPTEEDAPEGWEEGWFGSATLEWGYDADSSKDTEDAEEDEDSDSAKEKDDGQETDGGE